MEEIGDMRLTVEEDPETIKRYGHIKPGRAWGGRLCSSRCPGTTRACTLRVDHRGPHVAHGMFGRVLAVWDGAAAVRRSKESLRRAVQAREGREVRIGDPVRVLETLRKGIIRLFSSLEQTLMLVFFIAFVVFVIQWLLLLLR